MDPEDVIARALENELGRERRETRQMELSLRTDRVALQEKRGERSTLKRKKQEMLAKEAVKKKLVDDFLVLITAIENNDLETAKNFDEQAIMNNIATMKNSDAGEVGRFIGGYGDNSLPGIDLSPEEKAAIDAIVALENGVGSSGGDNGGLSGSYEDKNLPGIDLGLEKNAAMDGNVALENGAGSCGGDNGGFAGSHGGFNKAPENAHNGEEDKMVAAKAPENAHNGEEDKMTAAKGTKCDGGEGCNVGGHGGNYSGNHRKSGDGGYH